MSVISEEFVKPHDILISDDGFVEQSQCGCQGKMLNAMFDSRLHHCLESILLYLDWIGLLIFMSHRRIRLKDWELFIHNLIVSHEKSFTLPYFWLCVEYILIKVPLCLIYWGLTRCIQSCVTPNYLGFYHHAWDSDSNNCYLHHMIGISFPFQRRSTLMLCVTCHHLLDGHCTAYKGNACRSFMTECNWGPATPSVIVLTALHNAASDKSFPLDAMKSICASIGITCPANHQQSSLLCQLQSQIDNMHYLPKSSHTPSST